MDDHIRKIKIYRNKEDISYKVYTEVLDKLNSEGFEITDEEPDLVVCIGGDGTFINALKDMEFHTKPLYVGIHTGHLGFLQEINTEHIDEFIRTLKKEDYIIEKHRIQETKVIQDDCESVFHTFNEIVIREESLKVLHINVKIDSHEFEKFSGDGVIISTPIGSTAYNMSAGGGLVFPSLDILQLTPLAPLTSGAYRSITNSVLVPPDKCIKITPESERNISLCCDGELFAFSDVTCVQSYMSEKYVKMLRFENYSFWTRIKEKFL